MNHYDEGLYRTYANESVLLLDEALIERERGIDREVVLGEKIPFVLEPEEDRPWEVCGPGLGSQVFLYGTVLYDDLVGKYRMWYMCRMGPHYLYVHANYQIPGLFVPRTKEKPYSCNGVTADKYGREFVDDDRGDLTCYAESDDGVNWAKPNLGVFTFNGSPDNNIVWDLHGAAVFIDREEANPQKRYKAIGFCRRYRNIFLITSPDGIHWDDKDYIEPVALRRDEGTFNVTYDGRSRIYRAFSGKRMPDKDKRRNVCYTESPSLLGPWKEPRPILQPTFRDDEIARNRYGAFRAEHYGMSAWRYGSVYLGLLHMLYVTDEEVPGQFNQMPCDGKIDVKLVYSRDGAIWEHADADRNPVIPRGEGDAFDRGMIIGNPREPVIEGDDIHWYYTGSVTTHGVAMEKWVTRIGRATWKKDRFLALVAKDYGEILTKAVLPPEGIYNLQINGDAAGGRISVELCDPEGGVLDGFSREECVPLTRDDLRWQVTWKTGDLSAVKGPVKIRFVLERAKIYSYAFCKRDDE